VNIPGRRDFQDPYALLFRHAKLKVSNRRANRKPAVHHEIAFFTLEAMLSPHAAKGVCTKVNRLFFFHFFNIWGPTEINGPNRKAEIWDFQGIRSIAFSKLVSNPATLGTIAE
jgi:hypothetical protein